MNRREFLHTTLTGSAALSLTGNKSSAVPFDVASSQRTLSGHRIAKIESYRSKDTYSHFVGRDANGNPFKFGFARDVRILVTDQGTMGGAMSGATTEEAERFIGKSVADLYDMQSGVSDSADGIELPLYDLVGQILQQPVYSLLGGKGPTEVPIYSSNIHFEDLEPAQQAEGIGRLLRECKTDYDLGFRAFKIKIGRGFRWMQKEEGDQRDIDVTRAVRENFPDCKILVDANDGYTESDFENYITAVTECDLYCIEEPFHETIDDYKRLRDHMHKVDCKAKLMDGEKRIPSNETSGKYGGYSPQQIELLLKLAEEKLIDLVNMDLAIIGFTRWLRLMPELKTVGVLASPHTWAGTPRPYYAAHLAAGVGNCDFIEGIPGKATGLDYSAYKVEQGKLVIADAPGFGIGLRLS